MRVKTAISLPEDVFQQLDHAAQEQRLSRSGVILAALEKYLFDLETERIRQQWATIPPEDFELDDDEKDWLAWSFEEHMKRLDEDDRGWPDARP